MSNKEYSQEQNFKKRLLDLANQSYRNTQYTFTGFLNQYEQSVFLNMERELSFAGITLYGGNENCERRIARFGSEEMCGYEEPFPIQCIFVEPLAPKFAKQLTHRDYLGSLMHLGIDRAMIGDILVKEKTAYVFLIDKMTDFVLEELTKVANTNVKCKCVEDVSFVNLITLEEQNVIVSSLRADGVISKLYRLSRTESIRYFQAQKVFVNGKLTENNSMLLKEGDVVSVRGFGKFKVIKVSGKTKKDKILLDLGKYC